MRGVGLRSELLAPMYYPLRVVWNEESKSLATDRMNGILAKLMKLKRPRVIRQDATGCEVQLGLYIVDCCLGSTRRVQWFPITISVSVKSKNAQTVEMAVVGACRVRGVFDIANNAGNEGIGHQRFRTAFETTCRKVGVSENGDL